MSRLTVDKPGGAQADINNLIASRARQAIIRPRRERQLRWLKIALAAHTRCQRDGPYAEPPLGITVNVNGGVAFDRDLRDLVKRGYLTLVRKTYHGASAYPLSRSVLQITSKGRWALNPHVQIVPHKKRIIIRIRKQSRKLWGIDEQA